MKMVHLDRLEGTSEAISQSLGDIAKQLAISNKLKLEELRILGLTQEERRHYRMMIEGNESMERAFPHSNSAPSPNPIDQAFREQAETGFFKVVLEDGSNKDAEH